jgi:RimJ/RimL family protein N-acetyltransferase
MNGEVHLRDVADSDLPIFFEHQRDPIATRMAAFPAREREPFMAHWAKILTNPGIYKQTIVFEDQVAGNVVSFEQDGQREVGYWLGREFWGKGIATRALSAFLKLVTERPLYGYVARHNLGSQRVLEKCGFHLWGESVENDDPDGEPIVDLIYRLTADNLY